MAERLAQFREFRVIKRSNRDREGTQLGNRRNRRANLSSRVRCCSSK